jgi:predicted SprT family Zn-dependent metalloprotease
MKLPLTPHIVAAAYEYLRATPPFRGWKLPDAEAVEFGVTRHRDRQADHTHYLRTNEHIIRVSSYHVGTSLKLLEAVAHEMIHLHQWRTRKASGHDRWFNKTSERVARLHGWEIEVFE